MPVYARDIRRYLGLHCQHRTVFKDAGVEGDGPYTNRQIAALLRAHHGAIGEGVLRASDAEAQALVERLRGSRLAAADVKIQRPEGPKAGEAELPPPGPLLTKDQSD